MTEPAGIGGRSAGRTLRDAVLLGLAYWLVAMLGLQWAAVGGAGSPVWPAAGIGLAGLLLGGVRLWPVITVARLLAGLATGTEQSLLVEGVIALGNGLATALPVWLLGRLGAGGWASGSAGGTGAALVPCALAAAHALLTAVIGTSALTLLAGLSPAAAPVVGLNWWFGAFVGAVTVTPLIMAWAQPAQWRMPSGEAIHLGAMLFVTAGLSAVIFVSDVGLVLRTWAIFPILIWAALAFGIPGAALALLIASSAAIWGATVGVGPFTDLAATVGARTALAQQFSALTAVTVLILAAIADERRGREALERSEARLKDVLESTTDSVFVLDRDFRLTYLNSNAVRMVAGGRDLLGQSLWDAFPDAVDSEFFRAYTTAMETGRPTTVDEYFEPLDIWFEANAYPFSDGLTVFFRDVTEQRRAAERLVESEARMRIAQAVGGVVTWQWVIGSDEIRWSGPVEKVIGVPAGAAPGFDEFLAIIHPDDRGEVLQRVELAIATGGSYHTEFRILPPDGSTRWLVASGEVLTGEESSPDRLIGINYDVTERRKLTEELERLNADLETRVAEGAAQLHQLQKIESLGQLTGGVAHDFNNLLAAVLSALGSLRRHLPEGDERAHRLLDNAEAGARRGATLTQRMLAFARRQDLEPEPVDVPALVKGMQDLLDRSLGPHIAIETDFAPDLPPVLADPAQLELALLNLSVNARDAMPDGGLLRIEAAPVENGLVSISVTDTGTGMDETTIARATEPFFTTKGVGRGTGLGLPMVYGLAEQSGGRFVLRSRLGDGTTATLLLPRAEEAPRRERPSPPPPPEASAIPLRILAVDDDALVLMGTVDMLEDMGHRVWSARSGEEALGLLTGEARDADLVVTDQAMPGMTGVELARRVRETRPGLPVILATGYAELPSGAEVHVTARLGKPFTEAQLSTAIARAAPARPADVAE
jgi:PAS domain S-box-containing protein